MRTFNYAFAFTIGFTCLASQSFADDYNRYTDNSKMRPSREEMRQWRERYEYEQKQINEHQKIVSKNTLKGMASSKISAKQDYVITQFNLGVKYYFAENVSQDYA